MSPLSAKLDSMRKLSLPSLSSRTIRFASFWSTCLLTSVFGSASLSATEIINEELRDGNLPFGWTQIDVDFPTGAGGYANFTSTSAILTTAEFDASEFADVRVEFQVAKFGTGGDGPITVEYSLNGGDDWLTLGNSPTPTGSTYLGANLLIEAVSDTMLVRFTRADSPSGKRLRDVVISGTAENTEPLLLVTPNSLDNFNYFFDEGPSAPFSFVVEGENLDETDVTITAPDSFSVATVETGPFTSESILTAFDGTPTTIYVQLNAGLSVRGYLGEVTVSGGGADSESIALSGVVVGPTPVLTDFGIENSYFENFAGFISGISIPSGWDVTNQVYNGDWGTGFSAGLRGNADVLGFQHTANTGVFTVTLTVENQTGETIEALSVSYLGKVERATEGRSPEWTVTVNGSTIGELAYSTSGGVDETKTALISGLSIPDEETFTVTWSSDRDFTGGGSSRQIGISDFQVFAVGEGNPVLVRNPSSLSGFTYVEGTGPSAPQTFTVSGEDLDSSDVNVSSPGSFEFSISESSGYTNPLNLTAFDGEETTIYVRLVSGLSVGNFSETITIAGGGAASQTVSSSGTVTAPNPILTSSSSTYSQDFSTFDGIPNLPAGWIVSDQTYSGDWGTGSGGGLRGNANVLGYQHTGSTGVFTATLTLINDTGEPINGLDISYLGRVARVDQNRFPEWTVSVNGVVQSGLTYSTAAGVDQTISALATGFNVPDGELVTIVWSSDGSEAGSPGSGSRRQIGIGDVDISVANLAFGPPAFSLSSGFYTSDQTVFITNFDGYSPSTEVFYTLDGTTPTSSSTLYDDGDGIFIATGNGTITLQAIAVDGAEETSVSSATYEFPVNVASIEDLRNQPTGPTPILLTNPATFIGGTEFRNTKFFQDDSGFGIQIDDFPGLIETTYDIGDQVGSLYGTLGVFQGQLRLSPLEDPGAPVATGVVIEPVARTLPGISPDDQSRLVVIEGIVFDAGDGVAIFGGGGFTTGIEDLAQPPNEGLFRNVFGESDITDSIIPNGPVTITGIIQQSNAGFNLAARNLADIVPFVVLPEITSPLTASGDFDEPFTYTITATGDPVSFGATGLPAGLALDTETGIISGTPTESSLTPFLVELSATNAGELTGIATLELTINPTPVTITFTGPTAFTFSGSSQSPDFTVDPNVSVELNYTGTGETSYGPTADAPVNAGTYLLTVTVTEENFGAVESQAFTIAPAAQTITFAPLPARDVNDDDFIITATSDSGLPVSFLIAGPATIIGDSTSPATVSLTGVEGEVTVTAVQAGNDNILPASDVVRTFAVTAVGQSIFTFTGNGFIPDDINQTTTFDLEVTGEGTIEELLLVLSLNHPEMDQLTARLLAPIGTDGPTGRLDAVVFAIGSVLDDLEEETYPLSAFEGLPMAGTWTLEIFQSFSLNEGFFGHGELTLFELIITEEQPQPLSLADFLDALPAGLNGLEDDASGDGMSNLLVFALGGSNGAVSNVNLLPVPEIGCGPNRLALTFLRRAGGTPLVDGYVDVDGLMYIIESSTDLSPTSWASIAVNEIDLSTDGVPVGYVRVTVCPEDPLSLDCRAFLRLRVEYEEE